MNYNICEKSFLQAINLINNEKYLRILNYLLLKHNQYGKVFPSRYLIAKMLNISIRTVQRAFNLFHKLNLITKQKRYNSTNLFTINILFYKFADQLKDKFYALKYSTRYLLHSLSAALQKTFSKFGTSSINSINNNIPVYSKSYITQGIGTGKKYKRRRMDAIEISPMLRNATNLLKLTRWGQFKLLPFAEEALEHAISQYPFAKNVKNKFNWFFMTCKDYSEKNNLQIDWHLFYQFKEAFNMPEDARYVFEEEKKPAKRYSDPVPEIVDLDLQLEYDKWEKDYASGKYTKIETVLGFKMVNPYKYRLQGAL